MCILESKEQFEKPLIQHFNVYIW